MKTAFGFVHKIHLGLWLIMDNRSVQSDAIDATVSDADLSTIRLAVYFDSATGSIMEIDF